MTQWERGNSTTHASFLKNQFALPTGDGSFCTHPSPSKPCNKTKLFKQFRFQNQVSRWSARIQLTPPLGHQSQGATWPGPGPELRRIYQLKNSKTLCHVEEPSKTLDPTQAGESLKAMATRSRCHITFIFVSLDFFLFCNVLLGPPTPPEAQWPVARAPS